MAVKAIETIYAGHQFRSRLEARWAVFFDNLGIAWKYEPQGFVISGWGFGERNYLPDFYLPELEVWVEVKGDASLVDWEMLATAVDAWSISGLPVSRHAYSGNCKSRGAGRRCSCNGCGSAVLVLGDIPRVATDNNWLSSRDVCVHYALVNAKGVRVQGAAFTESGGIDFHYREIGYFDSTWGGGAEVAWLPPYARPDSLDEARSDEDQISSRVRRAYDAARKARFEHGRKG